jgi:hypothetical protein
MRTRIASGEDVRRDGLLKTGYLVALLLVLVPLLDALVRTWPMRLGDERWRYGTSGILLNTMTTPLLGVFVAMLIAAALEHRRTLRVIAGVTLVAGVTVLAAIGAFGLDYLQLRASVTAEAMGGFDAASRKAIVLGLLSAAVTIVLGIAGWRAAGRLVGSRRGGDVNVGLVIPKEEKA